MYNIKYLCAHVCNMYKYLPNWQVHNVLEARGVIKSYPLFKSVYEICYEGKPAQYLIETLGGE